MKPICVFRHLAWEGPGYLATFLERRGVPMRLIAIDEAAEPPDSIEDASALVFMGGPMSVNDPLPWIEQECRLIRQAMARNMPVLGHCLGGQLIAKALGGTVSANPVREVGWFAVQKRVEGQNNPWLQDLPQCFEVLHWHGETFSIPSGATPLLCSDDCANQAFSVGSALALQFHVEMTEAMVKEWIARNTEDLENPSRTVQTPAQLQEDLSTRIKALNSIADKFYTRWLNLVTRRARRVTTGGH